MSKPVVTPAPVVKTLSEQKSDFTAEGSPPPGKAPPSTSFTPSTPSTPASAPQPQPQPEASAQRPVREKITLKGLATRPKP